MDTHFSDDDELAKLKTWWKNYGSALMIGVVLGVGGLFGNRYWNQYQAETAATASGLYDNILYSIMQKQPENASRIGTQLMEQYDSTPYAGMAALILARLSYEKGDSASARLQLEWAMNHAVEAATKHAARLRLARLKGEVGETDAAIALLSAKDFGGFTSEYQELTGDLLAAKGELSGARQAYAQALADAGTTPAYQQILRMKLADLGSEEDR